MKKSLLKGNGRIPAATAEAPTSELDKAFNKALGESASSTVTAIMKPKGKGKAAVQATPVTLKELRKVVATIRVVGDTPLIVNQFSEKAKQQIRDKQGQKAKQPHAAKHPDADFKASLYRLPDGSFGIPARAIKAALVTAANDVNLVKTVIKRVVRVMPLNGDPNDVDGLVKIDSPPILRPISPFDKEYWEKLAAEHKNGCYMREDAVRLAQGQADLRYRACFPTWSATFQVLFIERLLSVEQLYALVEVAGMCGLCEWRPSSPLNESGQFGCFHFDRLFEGLRVELFGGSAD